MSLATKPYHIPWCLRGPVLPPPCAMKAEMIEVNAALGNVPRARKFGKYWVRQSSIAPLDHCHVPGTPGLPSIGVEVLFQSSRQVCGLQSQAPGFKSWFPITSWLCDLGLLINLSVLQLSVTWG